MKNPQTPNGLVHKKVMLTDANGKPDGRYVYVLAKPEPKVTQHQSVLSEIETLELNRRALMSLATKGLSPLQVDRLAELVGQTEKKIADLTMSLGPDHGPHALNGVGYEKYVCPTNPQGFCLSVQNHIASLIHEIMCHPKRKFYLGRLPESATGSHNNMSASVYCGNVPNDPIDLSAILKIADCLDKDMWPYFQISGCQGEPADLKSMRQELFCLTGITPPCPINERGNPKGV